MWAAVVAVTGALALAGCADAVNGNGNGANPVVSSSAPTAFPSATPTLPTSTPTATPTDTQVSSSVATPSTPTGSATASSSAPPPSCAGADYCDGFGDRTSGWDSTSQKDYTIGYSSRGGGSYLVQSHYNGVIYSTAPVNVTSFAPDYDLRVEADVAVTTPGPSPEVGLRCWGHDASNGGNAGFSGYLTPTTVTITLRTESGKIVPLKNRTVSKGLPTDGTPVHLGLACTLSKTSAGTTVATVRFAVNGTVQLATSYARTAKNYRWATGKDVGVLLGDKGAQGYFDNVGVTHISS